MNTILGHKGFRYSISFFLPSPPLLPFLLPATLSSRSLYLILRSCSPDITELVELMKDHLKHLIPPIVESAERIDDVFKKKKHIPHLAESNEAAATVLRKIEKEYFLFRKQHIEQKTLANLHPAIRQFTTFLYPLFLFYIVMIIF
jgi:hypothetical protein